MCTIGSHEQVQASYNTLLYDSKYTGIKKKFTLNNKKPKIWWKRFILTWQDIHYILLDQKKSQLHTETCCVICDSVNLYMYFIFILKEKKIIQQWCIKPTFNLVSPVTTAVNLAFMEYLKQIKIFILKQNSKRSTNDLASK